MYSDEPLTSDVNSLGESYILSSVSLIECVLQSTPALPGDPAAVMHILVAILFLTFLLTSNLGSATPLFRRDTPVNCEATTWRDILLFYLINYFAHAATAISPPGARSRLIFRSQLICLFYPFHGLLKAVSLLLSHCVFGTYELGKALSVGALTVVSRTESWKPPTKSGEELLCSGLPDEFFETEQDD